MNNVVNMIILLESCHRLRKRHAANYINQEVKKKMPVTSRDHFNMANLLFKKMATTMSELSAPDFPEKFNLLLDIYELKKTKKLN